MCTNALCCTHGVATLERETESNLCCATFLDVLRAVQGVVQASRVISYNNQISLGIVTGAHNALFS